MMDAASALVPSAPAPTCPRRRGEKKPVWEFKPQAVYAALLAHQTMAEESELELPGEWTFHELVKFMTDWARIFIREFRLEIPMPPITVESMRIETKGRFRDRNGQGLRGEIAINTHHLDEGKEALLHTLLVLRIRLWQENRGTPSPREDYFNKEFRTKSREVGLRIDARGHAVALPYAKFTELLKKHGIELDMKLHPEEKPRSKSKLQVWKCACNRAWIAVRDVQWTCTRCHCPVTRVEWPE